MCVLIKFENVFGTTLTDLIGSTRYSSSSSATIDCPRFGHFLPGPKMRDAGDLAVDGDSVVVEGRRLQDDARRPDANSQSENPKK